MRILAVDLGKNKSVFVDYLAGNGQRDFGKIDTNAPQIEKLLRRCVPDQLVIEACPAAGWVCDLAERLKVPVRVANGNGRVEAGTTGGDGFAADGVRAQGRGA
jgi:hypothetical protein